MIERRRTHWELLLLVSWTTFAFSCGRPAAPSPPPAATLRPAPPPPPAAPSMRLAVNPRTIERGQPTTLRWQAENAGAVRIEPGIGDVPASGSRQVSPNSSVTYTATARGPGGTSTDTARVTVREPAPPPVARPEPPPSPNISVEDLFRRQILEIYFDYDSADIRSAQISRLQDNVRWLRDHPDVRFTLEGHCDERGSQAYNIGLGDQRANGVEEFIVSQGINESRMRTVSFGEERPQCNDETESCYQRNRRVEFTLIE